MTSKLYVLPWLALGLAGCVGAPPAGAPAAAALGEVAPSAEPATVAVAAPSWRTLAFPDAPDAVVTEGPRFRALSLRRGERTLSLHSSDAVHADAPEGDLPSVEPTDVVRGRPAYVTVNEGIRSVAWEEGGAFHALEVECFRPFEDAHCTEPEFILELAETLEGGAQ